MTTPFFTFVGDQCGKATEAIRLYTSLFPDSEIKEIIHYREGEGGGTPELIKYGVFTLQGKEYGVSESNYTHNWGFSPAMSILVTHSDAAFIQKVFETLSGNGGQVMVPLDNYHGEGDYGFGKQFGWCADKYGVNWQLILSD